MRFLPRRTGTTTLATLAAFAAAFVVIHLVAPTWAHAAGLDVWKIDEAVAQSQREAERERELNDVMEQLQRHTGACDSVVLSLIEGRISFDAAVNQIDEITRERPNFDETLSFVHPMAKTHRERVARYTMERVRTTFTKNASRQSEKLERLETAYREMMAKH